LKCFRSEGAVVSMIGIDGDVVSFGESFVITF
jgi:hypothetical protein